MMNPRLIDLIEYLKEKSAKEEVRIWKDIAERLSKRRISVNLSKINRHTKENDQIVVPGKVLGSGSLDHPVTIGAFGFSQSAREKIKKSKGKSITIKKLTELNPSGSGVKIIQ